MSTQELLLINKYSDLLDKYERHTKALQAERDEAIRQAKMYYENSRSWKAKYEILQQQVNRLHKELK